MQLAPISSDHIQRIPETEPKKVLNSFITQFLFSCMGKSDKKFVRGLLKTNGAPNLVRKFSVFKSGYDSALLSGNPSKPNLTHFEQVDKLELSKFITEELFKETSKEEKAKIEKLVKNHATPALFDQYQEFIVDESIENEINKIMVKTKKIENWGFKPSTEDVICHPFLSEVRSNCHILTIAVLGVAFYCVIYLIRKGLS